MSSFRLRRKTSKTMEKSTPTLAEQVVNNEDLLTEILLKVPSKSLLRLKLVSKQWRDLISSTSFRRSHTRTHHGSLKPCALFLDRISTPSEVGALPLNFHDDSLLPPLDFFDLPDRHSRLPPLDFLDLDFPNVKILESCGGLLLCKSLKNSHEFWRTYFICNPTTREFKILPTPSPEYAVWSCFNANLAFDPLKSPHYKIIYVTLTPLPWNPSIMNKNRDEKMIHSYSSEINSWSSSKIFIRKKGVQISQAVFFNGAIHWYGTCEESQYFDVDKESLGTMPMPKVKDVAYQYFGECGGHLNLVFAHREACLTFSIYEMEKDYSNWYSKHRLSLEAEIRTFWSRTQPINYVNYLLISTIQSEEGDFMMFAAFQHGRAISYNFKNGTLTELQCTYDDKQLSRGGIRIIRGCKYFETLSCV